jgi:hypothetical protein
MNENQDDFTHNSMRIEIERIKQKISTSSLLFQLFYETTEIWCVFTSLFCSDGEDRECDHSWNNKHNERHLCTFNESKEEQESLCEG